MRPFQIERFFARHEFTARYQLSCSDCEALTLRELIEGAPADTLALWDGLRFGYTETQGHPVLRDEIATLYESVRRDDVMVAVPEEAIFVLMHGLLRPGDHVTVITPAYQSLYEVARAAGCEVTQFDLRVEDGEWRLDLAELERNLRPDTRLLVANFPHNPTGYMPSRREFDALVEMARIRGMYVLGDEMYRYLEREPGDRLPAMCDAYEKGISLSGLSKAYGLPGLRLGWLATRAAEVLERCLVVKDYTTICNSAPSEILGIAALRSRERLVERSREIVARNVAVAGGFFVRHAALFHWLAPRGGPVAFPIWTGPGTVDEFCRRMLEDRSVVIVPGELFDHGGGHFRVGLGRLDFPEALAQVEEALGNGA